MSNTTPNTIPALAASLVLSTLFSGANPVMAQQINPGMPNCPWADPSHSWANFLSGQYGDLSDPKYHHEVVFSIKFSKTIGTITAGRCYTVIYLGNETWQAAGYNNVRKQSELELENGQPQYRHGGDPAKHELNVWGARFTYNEAGEVRYVPSNDLVGQMYCHIGADCDKESKR